MKNYDDLQRFKEKTKTLDIAFQDMSGQSQEAAEKSKWSLIRQLASDDQQMPFSGGQRIDLPQPQPIQGDEFSLDMGSALTQSAQVSTPASASSRSLINSLSASEPLPDVTEPASHASSSLFPTSSATPQAGVAVQKTHAPVTAPDTAPSIPARPEAENGRFSDLFRACNSASENLPKETLLKPLLEKIALCR